MDGLPAPIYRADYVFRAVPVPAGRHEVVFAYQPTLLVTGAVATGLTLAGASVALLLARRRVTRA